MKKLPPPNNGKPTKKSNGSSALVSEDYFKRFAHLERAYDGQVEAYEELRSAKGSHAVRILRDCSLSPMSDEERGDSLAKLWPNEDIHLPSRAFYVQRLALLVNSFPSAAPHSPGVYTQVLVSRVAVKEPSCMVVESACNELVDSYKYSNAPNIADLMLLIDKHEKAWQKRLEIDDEIQSGRARKRAEGRLAYEEEQEQKRVKWAIADLEKIKSEMKLKSKDRSMLAEAKIIKGLADVHISDLRESGIDELDEECISELRSNARVLKEKDRDQDPDYKAILAFLEPFKLWPRAHDELAQAIYKEAIPASVVDAVAKGIPPDARGGIRQRLAGYKDQDFARFREITFKALHAEQDRQEGKAPREEQPRQNNWTLAKRIRF
jgi:hypothetical protein